ncbi:MAG: hypothetical protein Ta2E_01840 [Mycoplasmoidaceae bacterium]|nr:MAG: hypothetical protein Ta2E_01840 [Mycoplasmoidaceae bacterium]
MNCRNINITEGKGESHCYNTGVVLTKSEYNLDITLDVIDNLRNNKRINLRKAKLDIDREEGEYFSL